MVARKDKLINKAKVTKEVIKHPESTQRKIAKDAGVGLGTANRILQELEQTGTESIILDNILKMDDEIIALSNGLTLDMLKEKIELGEILSIHDHKTISDIANNSTKRKAIFGNKKEGDDKIAFIFV